MKSPVRAFALSLAACCLCVSAIAYAAQEAPLGGWRTTNECFLALFVLTDNGRAQAAYVSGERDDDATWSWDGTTLTIVSAAFPMDSFAGHLTNDRVQADYVWHDMDKDQLNKQACTFESFTPFRLF